MLDYVPTSKNLVDSFTKGLSRNVIHYALKEIGLRPTTVFKGEPNLCDRRSLEVRPGKQTFAARENIYKLTPVKMQFSLIL